jgi:hypothetical protein
MLGRNFGDDFCKFQGKRLVNYILNNDNTWILCCLKQNYVLCKDSFGDESNSVFR